MLGIAGVLFGGWNGKIVDVGRGLKYICCIIKYIFVKRYGVEGKESLEW